MVRLSKEYTMTEMVTKWVNRFTPLYADVKRKIKQCDIVAKSIVKATGILDGAYEQVLYITPNKAYIGWVHTDDLENYVRNFTYNVVSIEDQTPNPSDFEQYIMYQSIKQVNMCGELCVAYITNQTLGNILTKWKQDNSPMWKRFFQTDQPARGTTYSDLAEILTLFNYPSEPLVSALYQSHIGRARYTQKSLTALLKKGHVIMSVSISPSSGLIQPNGVLHWIVLLNIVPERNGQGFVTFYNPAMNCIEGACWDGLMASAKAPYGLFVPDATKDQKHCNIFVDVMKGG
jgi:hypothetical protein